MTSRLFWVPLVACLLPVAALKADEGHSAHKHKSHSHDKTGGHHHDADEANTGAHVHGEVLLQLALQGENLVMELTSPAMNLVGFEHRASTPEQIEAVNTAETKLRQVAKWLKLDGGECQVMAVSTNLSGVQPQAEREAGKKAHADIKLEAQYACAEPTKLRGLQVALFQNFPGVEKVTVQWAAEAGAGERVLTRIQSSLNLAP